MFLFLGASSSLCVSTGSSLQSRNWDAEVSNGKHGGIEIDYFVATGDSSQLFDGELADGWSTRMRRVRTASEGLGLEMSRAQDMRSTGEILARDGPMPRG